MATKTIQGQETEKITALYCRLSVDDNKDEVIVKKIEVHKPEKKHAHNSVKIDITFTAIGLFSIPEEKELLEMARQAQAENQQLSA